MSDKDVKNSDLVHLSKLLKEKKYLIREHPDATQKIHKINVIRHFIEKIANGNIRKTIEKLENQLVKLRSDRLSRKYGGGK